jgi:transposase
MKDGTTHLAHKAEHAVDMETGAVIAVTLQAADQGDTTTIKETLAETAENIAHLIEREAEKAPDAEPQVSLTPMTEIVADKGYHSGETVLAVQQAQARSYIPEPKRPRRKWAGKAAEQEAVYANRRRVKGTYGKRLLKKRDELIERSFAHCYETGAMRRLYLRGRENVLKRQLIHVGAFNLSLIFRQKLGAGTPRELRNRQSQVVFVVLTFGISLTLVSRASQDTRRPFRRRLAAISRRSARSCRHRIFGGFRHGLLALWCSAP